MRGLDAHPRSRTNRGLDRSREKRPLTGGGGGGGVELQPFPPQGVFPGRNPTGGEGGREKGRGGGGGV